MSYGPIVFVVNGPVNPSPGKVAAHISHASRSAALLGHDWEACIVLVARTEGEFEAVRKVANTSADAGYTEVERGTVILAWRMGRHATTGSLPKWKGVHDG